MSIDKINISNEELQFIDFEQALSESVGSECADYRGVFEKKAAEADSRGDASVSAWTVLSGIASMRLDSSDKSDPFKPMFEMAGSRGCVPADLSEVTLDALSIWVSDIADSEFKSRIADILWLRRRNPECLSMAVTEYIDAALKLEDPEHWPATVTRFERALKLSSMQRRQRPGMFQAVVAEIAEIIDKYDGNDPLFMSLRLIELLYEDGKEYAEKYFGAICTIAEKAVANSNWHKAEVAWRNAERCSTILGDDDKRNMANTQLAETLAKRAEAGDHGLASSKFMTQAIEAYKRVPDSKERRNELYDLLRGYQKQSLENMTAYRSPIMDLSESVDRSINEVSGKDFEDALFRLAFRVAVTPDYDDIKERAIEESQKFVFSSLMGAIHMDTDGLVIAETPPFINFEDGEDSKAIWGSMLRHVGIFHGLEVQGAIEHARNTIDNEHFITIGDCMPIVQDNPIVPAGHEYIYAKGLYSGLVGNFIDSSHFLIPQIENSLRYILEKNGVETTTINPHGLQERLRLNALLKHDVLIRVLGKNTLLDYRALLVEPIYGNLRNEVTHGLVEARHFFQPIHVYLWWRVLRMCLTPYYKRWNEDNAGDESS